jgi:hypothetical protein
VNPLRASDGLIARDIDRLNVLAALDSILVRRPARGLFSIHEEGAALDSCAYFLAVHRVCRDESGETNLPPNAFLRTPNDAAAGREWVKLDVADHALCTNNDVGVQRSAAVPVPMPKAVRPLPGQKLFFVFSFRRRRYDDVFRHAHLRRAATPSRSKLVRRIACGRDPRARHELGRNTKANHGLPRRSTVRKEGLAQTVLDHCCAFAGMERVGMRGILRSPMLAVTMSFQLRKNQTRPESERVRWLRVVPYLFSV